MSAVSPSATFGFTLKGAGNEITEERGVAGVGWEISRDGGREEMK